MRSGTRCRAAAYDHNEVAFANYLDWQAQSQSFEQLALYRWWSANLTGIDPPERIQGFLVTANFLDALGMKPIMGRNFSAGRKSTRQRCSRHHHSQSLAETFRRRSKHPQQDDHTQQRRTHGRRSDAGTFQLSQRLRGLCAAGDHAGVDEKPRQSQLLRHRTTETRRFDRKLRKRILDNIAARLEQQYPETNTGWGATVFPIVADTVRQYDTALWVMMGAVGFVLLIACANVANLMLARASGRQKEIALRAALGASRWRIIRQLLTESVIVALIGGALGVLVAFWGIDALRAANPGDAAKYAPGWYQLGLNFTVLAFTLGLSLFSGIVFGLAPALQVSKPNLNDSLKEGSRQTSGRSHRLRSSLVVFEVALSLVLLVGAGLLARSFLSLLKNQSRFQS